MKGMVVTVSKLCVSYTTGKDSAMSAIIFSFLFIVIVLCGLWFHDVRYPPEGHAERKKWKHAPDRSSGKSQPDSQPADL
jgi:hypothetical protein